MGREALDAAIANYHGKSYEHIHDEDGEIICHCFGVGANKIKKVVWENHLTTVEEVTNYTKAGGGCQSCHMRIEEIIDEVWVDLERCGVPRPGFTQTPIQGIKIATTTEKACGCSTKGAALDAATLESPYFEKIDSVVKELNAGFTDGSAIEIQGIANNDVKLKFNGNIASGMMHDMTLNFFKSKLEALLGDQAKSLNIQA